MKTKPSSAIIGLLVAVAGLLLVALVVMERETPANTSGHEIPEKASMGSEKANVQTSGMSSRGVRAVPHIQTTLKSMGLSRRAGDSEVGTGLSSLSEEEKDFCRDWRLARGSLSRWEYARRAFQLSIDHRLTSNEVAELFRAPMPEDNALTFTQPGGVCSVMLDADGRAFSVKDQDGMLYERGRGWVNTLQQAARPWVDER